MAKKYLSNKSGSSSASNLSARDHTSAPDIRPDDVREEQDALDNLHKSSDYTHWDFHSDIAFAIESWDSGTMIAKYSRVKTNNIPNRTLDTMPGEVFDLREDSDLPPYDWNDIELFEDEDLSFSTWSRSTAANKNTATIRTWKRKRKNIADEHMVGWDDMLITELDGTNYSDHFFEDWNDTQEFTQREIELLTTDVLHHIKTTIKKTTDEFFKNKQRKRGDRLRITIDPDDINEIWENHVSIRDLAELNPDTLKKTWFFRGKKRYNFERKVWKWKKLFYDISYWEIQ